MTSVDPFVVKWPRAWVSDPEIGPVVHYLNRFLHDLWVRTGSGDDDIQNSLDQISDNSLETKKIHSEVSKIDQEFKDISSAQDILESKISSEIKKINGDIDDIMCDISIDSITKSSIIHGLESMEESMQIEYLASKVRCLADRLEDIEAQL